MPTMNYRSLLDKSKNERKFGTYKICVVGMEHEEMDR